MDEMPKRMDFLADKSICKLTDSEFTRQQLHVQVAFEFVLDAGNGRFDSIGILRSDDGLRLLG